MGSLSIKSRNNHRDGKLNEILITLDSSVSMHVLLIQLRYGDKTSLLAIE
jgi:hypothetical protein